MTLFHPEAILKLLIHDPFLVYIVMANTPSAIKKVRQIERRTVVNSRNKKSMRTQVKKLRSAVDAQDADGARELLASAVSALDRAVQKGVMKKNTASRLKSRLSLQVNRLTPTS